MDGAEAFFEEFFLKLFDIVPDNFFSVLSSRKRELYYDALMILYNIFSNELNIRVDDYLSSLVSMLEGRAFEPDEEDEIPEGSLSDMARARVLLLRLVRTGWVEEEFLDNSFVRILTPKSYAIPVLRMLRDLGEESQREYNSMVFATYSGLKQAMEEEGAPHLYDALLAARSESDALQHSLRTLYHEIRRFRRDASEKNDVNYLLSEHFDKYKVLLDRQYHPLKTMDSTHRYADPILDLLARMQSQEALQRPMIERAMKAKNYASEDEAVAEIDAAIDDITRVYSNVFYLVNDIDRRHSSYTKHSVEKIQYLMTTDQSIRGKLTDVLTAFAGASESEQEDMESLMNKHLQGGRQEFLDVRSFYRKSVRSRRVETEPLKVVKDLDLTGKAERFLLEQLSKSYSVARIREYVEALFADGRTEIESGEIPLREDSDFIFLILAMVRANEDGMPHVVRLREGQINNSGYLIPDMLICKKEIDIHVE